MLGAIDLQDRRPPIRPREATRTPGRSSPSGPSAAPRRPRAGHTDLPRAMRRIRPFPSPFAKRAFMSPARIGRPRAVDRDGEHEIDGHAGSRPAAARLRVEEEPQRGYAARSPPERVYHAARGSVTRGAPVGDAARTSPPVDVPTPYEPTTGNTTRASLWRQSPRPPACRLPRSPGAA